MHGTPPSVYVMGTSPPYFVGNASTSTKYAIADPPFAGYVSKKFLSCRCQTASCVGMPAPAPGSISGGTGTARVKATSAVRRRVEHASMVV